MGIVRFALRLPHTFYVIAALIVFLGMTAILAMPIDIFPEINIPVVTIIWQYTGLSTPEMEQRVTTYSEYSLSSNVTGIRDIEAQTLTAFQSKKSSFNPTSILISPFTDRFRNELHSLLDAAWRPAADCRAI
jgi:Cu/Ag efflux pump CusA